MDDQGLKKHQHDFVSNSNGVNSNGNIAKSSRILINDVSNSNGVNSNKTKLGKIKGTKLFQTPTE